MTTKPKIDDGGEAQDMSMRDWFAGMALQSVYKDAYEGLDGKPWKDFELEADAETIAINSYVMADAMIAARQP